MNDPRGVIPVDLGSGRTGRLYLVRFDKHGTSTSPENLAAFLAEASSAHDAFVFSHGWNNDYDIAVGAYKQFIAGYVREAPCASTPALLGVIWPATTFVFPWESGPVIAAAPPPTPQEALVDLVDDDATRDQLAPLLGDGTHEVDLAASAEAAKLVASVEEYFGDEADGSTPVGAQVEDLWRALGAQAARPSGDDERWGTAGAGKQAGPAAAALTLDPRVLIRMMSVWKMKARAGVIGARGVGPILRRLLSGQDGPRVHLTGHSFGARVVLSAISYGADAPERAARSILLLQPAVNRWCFAPDLSAGMPQASGPGGYAPALSRVELPVLTTYSDRDIPLHEVFHRVMGVAHFGEPAIAGGTNTFGALGGYGPNEGLGPLAVQVKPGATYPLAGGGPVRIVALNGGRDAAGHAAISGHGAVNNPTMWHALRCLVGA